jgi:hypothetical protein
VRLLLEDRYYIHRSQFLGILQYALANRICKYILIAAELTREEVV